MPDCGLPVHFFGGNSRTLGNSTELEPAEKFWDLPSTKQNESEKGQLVVGASPRPPCKFFFFFCIEQIE
jgi:hypothetical protein